MTYYRIITTIHYKTKVEFISAIQELQGVKPANTHFTGAGKATYYNHFDTPQQAEYFQDVNLKGKQSKGQISMLDLLKNKR